MKRVFCLMFAAALICALFGCSAVSESSPAEEYKVYTDSALLSGSVLNSDAPAYPWNKNVQYTKPEETTKTVVVNAKEYTVHYTESYIDTMQNEYYLYETADEQVGCRYWADNMELDQLILYNQDLSRFEGMDLEQYEQWIRQFVSQYSTEDWESLKPDYTTYIHFDSEKISGNRAEKGFSTEWAENETLRSRNFRYYHYVGAFKTWDSISVTFNYQSSYIIVNLNPHRFDALGINVDLEKIQSAVKDFIQTHKFKNYTLTEIDFGTPALMYSGNNLLCQMDITIHYTAKGNAEELDQRLLIDIPDLQ